MEGTTTATETTAPVSTSTETTTISPETSKMVDEISSGLFPDSQKTEAADESGGEEEAAAPVAKETPSSKAAEPAKPAEEVAKPAGPVHEPPKTFRPAAQEAFKKADPVLQEEILKRENDMFKGLESYKQNAAVGRSVIDVMKPYLPALEKAGINPLDQISGLMNAHYTLSTGTPAQKQAMFQKIAQEYGVYVAPNDAGGADAYVDPQVADLQKTVAELKSQQTAREAKEAETQRNTLQKEIDAFASDPANIYFDEVANDIAQLIKATGLSLKDAYEKAVWANPQTRAKEQARIQAESEEARKAEAARKAEEVRKATGANVRTKAKTASATASGARLSAMDDVLAEGLAEIKARH